MAKTNHFKTIVFTEDFGIRKKGEEWQCDTMLASQLVRHSKVAVYKDDSKPVVDVKEKETPVEKPVIKKEKKQKEK